MRLRLMTQFQTKLLKITDILGRETDFRSNEPLFYIYDDGSVRKIIVQ